jgi:hypothetical protein
MRLRGAPFDPFDKLRGRWLGAGSSGAGGRWVSLSNPPVVFFPIYAIL